MCRKILISFTKMGVIFLKNRFSIGEMSRLHNVPVKTLRFYDEIDLFKPMEIGANGYRFYASEQFEQLDTINYLKFLGFSLKEIKQHLKYRDVESFLELLRRQKGETERKISELEVIRNRFAARIDEIEKALQVDNIGKVVIKHISRRQILRLEERITCQIEIELALRKLKDTSYWMSALFIGKVGLTVAKDDLEQKSLDKYNSIFILIEDEGVYDRRFLKYLPESEYACIFFRGSHSQSLPYYRQLVEYVEANQLLINGDAVERTIIDQFITGDSCLHLTEIQIPVIKKT